MICATRSHEAVKPAERLHVQIKISLFGPSVSITYRKRKLYDINILSHPESLVDSVQTNTQETLKSFYNNNNNNTSVFNTNNLLNNSSSKVNTVFTGVLEAGSAFILKTKPFRGIAFIKLSCFHQRKILFDTLVSASE